MVSEGLLGDKERCGVCQYGICELYDEGDVEHIMHFLLYCVEFAVGYD